MSITKILRPKYIALGVVATVFASTSYGFAAANTVPANNAGDGANTISGYTVSAINYVLNDTNPANVDSVKFSLTGAAKPQTVKAKVVSAGTTYSTNCTAGTSTGNTHPYTCTMPAATTVADANNLRVIAAD